ncbi:alpha/beta fold hydrolase [Celerinatantimonas yamalensis]|uniref:Alpha/beta fold hydrolase n=1 Tax=Celerinatantimonas yamalensis TaxID=559956 RepID=A0ABW9G2F3_9GAMM
MPLLYTNALPYQGTAKHPQAVFLIHGLFGSGDNLTSLGKYLSKNFQVYLVDIFNHGQSPRMDSMNYRQHARAFLETMNELGVNDGYLVGHSMGGKLAMASALLAPERITKLVVADMSPVRYQHAHKQEFAGLNSVQLDQISNRRDADTQLAQYIDNSGVRQFLLKSLKREGPRWRWQFDIANLQAHYNDIIDWPFEQERFAGPTLFIKGQLSSYIQLTYQNAIVSQFPNAQIKIIAQAGHWLHAEKPQLFNRLVNQFFMPEN